MVADAAIKLSTVVDLAQSVIGRLGRLSSAPRDTINAALPPFREWLPSSMPRSWQPDAPHLLYLCDALDAITRGECRHLALTMPPRHAKTHTSTIRYSAWRIIRDPATLVVIIAADQGLANKMSRAVRKIVVANNVPLSSERNAMEEWETLEGGGLRATGVGGSIVGRGFNLLMIDDPVKEREQVRSDLQRENLWEWYITDLWTRQEPGSAIVVTLTRWHEDDLMGRILASEEGRNWRQVVLRAIAEEDDPLGRPVGAALWPERFPIEELERTKRVMGRQFYALYQGRPLPAEGGMFKRDWFQMVKVAPLTMQRRVRYWDKAGTEGDGDYTAGVLMGRDADGLTYVLDVVRGQWSSGSREKIMRQTAELDGRDVEVWIEQEPGSGGKDSAADSVRNLAGFAAYAEPVSGEKTVRAEPFASQLEARNVRIVEGEWNAAYISEFTSFPEGKNDDQVDGSSGAFVHLSPVNLYFDGLDLAPRIQAPIIPAAVVDVHMIRHVGDVIHIGPTVLSAARVSGAHHYMAILASDDGSAYAICIVHTDDKGDWCEWLCSRHGADPEMRGGVKYTECDESVPVVAGVRCGICDLSMDASWPPPTSAKGWWRREPDGGAAEVVLGGEHYRLPHVHEDLLVGLYPEHRTKPGETETIVDIASVYEAAKLLIRALGIQQVRCDPWSASQLAQGLSADTGVSVEEVKLSGPEQLRRAVLVSMLLNAGGFTLVPNEDRDMQWRRLQRAGQSIAAPDGGSKLLYDAESVCLWLAATFACAQLEVGW